MGQLPPPGVQRPHHLPRHRRLDGIHAFDWLLWILGDRFASVTAHGSRSAHPDYPAVESQSGYLFHLTDHGMATVTVDYLRPEAAPTHGDERIRIAGTEGVVEISTGYGWGTLIDKSGVHELTGATPRPWFAEWLRRAVLQEEPTDGPIHPQWEIFRATESPSKPSAPSRPTKLSTYARPPTRPQRSPAL